MIVKVCGPTGVGDYIVTRDRPNIHLVYPDGRDLAVPIKSDRLRMFMVGMSPEVIRQVLQLEAELLSKGR